MADSQEDTASPAPKVARAARRTTTTASTVAPTTALGRARAVSLSLLNASPPYGMWAATGTVLAGAPNIDELRQPVAGGQNLEFDGNRAAIRVHENADGEILVRVPSSEREPTAEKSPDVTASRVTKPSEKETGEQTSDFDISPVRRTTTTLHEAKSSEKKEPWPVVIKHGLAAFGKFAITPWGFLITIYGLNIVAWGAMLFFLLLDAAPAMDHPNKDSLQSPRKIWLEIDSQILNALFCVTGFGLAPWRFRDVYFLFLARRRRNVHARARLAEQNKSWFRPPISWESNNSVDYEAQTDARHPLTYTRLPTYTGQHAPPTSIWKLAFVIWMMAANSLLQAVLAFFMWHYNRFNRPTWATGTFIGLGCAVAMFAGLMTYFEGRKVKKIEGPVLIIEKEIPAEV